MYSAHEIEDYYSLLGLSDDATQEEIKRAYRTRARASHPDFGGSAETMRLLNEAYEILTDAEKRNAYDVKRYVTLKLQVKPLTTQFYSLDEIPERLLFRKYLRSLLGRAIGSFLIGFLCFAEYAEDGFFMTKVIYPWLLFGFGCLSFILGALLLFAAHRMTQSWITKKLIHSESAYIVRAYKFVFGASIIVFVVLVIAQPHIR